jgi:DNA-binding MarR family transcriptional regulator
VEDGVDRIEADWNRERPDIDVSSVGIVTRVWRIGRYLERRRNDVLLQWDTDRGTIDILGMLRRAGAPYRRTAGDLSRHSLITSGGVSQRLEKLERAGLVTRHVDTADRRRVEVELTAAGAELIDSVLSASMSEDSSVLAEALSLPEQETLRHLLRKLLVLLEPLDESGESDS